MRLATFNVLHGRSLVDDRVELSRFSAAVATLDADVLALQEVDRAQPRSGSADLTELAAQAGSYREARFVPALTGLPGTWRPARDGASADEPAYGVALLSRLPVRSWRTVHLPALRLPVPVVFSGRRTPQVVRDEPRVAAVAELEGADGPLTVVSTHLSFVEGWNVVQLRRLARTLADAPRLLLAGDLNMPPHRARRSSGLTPMAPGLTFPAAAPTRQLDHVLGRGVTTAGDPRVWDLPLSDHRALSLEVHA